MASPLNVTIATLNNGDVLCYGRHKMQLTTTPAMRHAVFNVPNLNLVPSANPASAGAPVVQATFDSLAQGFTQSMILVSMQIQPQTSGSGETFLQIDIDAGTPNGMETDLDYWCNITVIGAPI